MKSIRDYMICWTPDLPFSAGNPTRGNAALFLHPDRHRASRPYTSTFGACYSWTKKATDAELQANVKAEFIAMVIRDGLSPDVVHRCLWELKEYRDAIPEDVPAPATERSERRRSEGQPAQP